MSIDSITSKITLKHIYILLGLALLGICLQAYIASVGKIPPQYTRYNNYVIFKQSFIHLIRHNNLYLPYPGEYYDLYKYSPTFALLMCFFYYLPDFAGLFLFNLLNIFVFIIAIKKLNYSWTVHVKVLLFLLVESALSLSSNQTNLLIGGLIILAFALLEEEKYFWAALCLCITVYIKLFGLVGFCLFLLYPNKIKPVVYTILWLLILLVLPLIIIDRQDLVFQYRNWIVLLKEDHSVSYGASIMGLFHSWLGINLSKVYIVCSGTILLLIPFFRIKLYESPVFRIQILASVLLWVVIFNHKAESPTYIIAMAGVIIAYFSQTPRIYKRILLLLCIIFTSLSSTDLVTPSYIINHYVETYSLKAVFCSAAWFILIFHLIFAKADSFFYQEVSFSKRLD
jgi:hypothetical protein